MYTALECRHYTVFNSACPCSVSENVDIFTSQTNICCQCKNCRFFCVWKTSAQSEKTFAVFDYWFAFLLGYAILCVFQHSKLIICLQRRACLLSTNAVFKQHSPHRLILLNMRLFNLNI